jgi:hypothetical protein
MKDVWWATTTRSGPADDIEIIRVDFAKVSVYTSVQTSFIGEALGDC